MFRSGFSTMDHFQIVSQVTENRNEYKKLLYLVFIEYKRHVILLELVVLNVIRPEGVRQRHFRILKDIYKEGTPVIRFIKTPKNF